ncbi:MAG: tautomerase family protein [Gammaproteobacteria bacterium]|nr:tautomerase family protein [Gammaproteobacteria bacterium]MBU0785786.1 tautomerase family protein [Gammaproteobacteria bacterium]MBU0815717.1 tautomerase family protein [Gammaproteobacteria bacterium]MBU1788274.1 tautomerase family protein [Gammaproteobacteria bacterium]
MPTLQLKVSPAREPALYRQLAAALTELTAQTLDKQAELTAVMIEALPATQWYVGARDMDRPTAWLEISITAGTNTPAQKAAFVQAAYATLQRTLAAGQALEPVSYVIVREVPATDWGYGGQSQQARQLARATASGEMVK